ncbi:MAG TPA: hypothetical protein VK553_10675 [Candidatus Nitrosopolaris rasttigaisensis]|nr:hypothetical protein [Candidatus Nitrosopolaris rasttigaisensis]
MTAQSASHRVISTLQSIVIIGVISGIGLIRHDSEWKEKAECERISQGSKKAIRN